eukprot:g19315.t1
MAQLFGGADQFAQANMLLHADMGAGCVTPEQEVELAQRQRDIDPDAKIHGKQYAFLVAKAAANCLHLVCESDMVPPSCTFNPFSFIAGLLTIELLLLEDYKRLCRLLSDSVRPQIDPKKRNREGGVSLDMEEIYETFWKAVRKTISPKNLPHIQNALPPPFAGAYQRQIVYVLGQQLEERFKQQLLVKKQVTTGVASQDKRTDSKIANLRKDLLSEIRQKRGQGGGDRGGGGTAATPTPTRRPGTTTTQPGLICTEADPEDKPRICKPWLMGTCPATTSAGCPNKMLHYGGPGTEKDREGRITFVVTKLLKPHQRITEAEIKEKAKVAKC